MNELLNYTWGMLASFRVWPPRSPPTLRGRSLIRGRREFWISSGVGAFGEGRPIVGTFDSGLDSFFITPFGDFHFLTGDGGDGDVEYESDFRLGDLFSEARRAGMLGAQTMSSWGLEENTFCKNPKFNQVYCGYSTNLPPFHLRRLPNLRRMNAARWDPKVTRPPSAHSVPLAFAKQIHLDFERVGTWAARYRRWVPRKLCLGWVTLLLPWRRSRFGAKSMELWE